MQDRKRRAAPAKDPGEPEPRADARVREISGLATHLQALAEKEKAAIARTLHDELGGLLTAAKMDLSWIQSRAQTPQLQERLAQLGSVLDEAMDLKRRLVDELRPSLLDHFGLPTALRTYVGSVCAKAGLEADISVADEAQDLPRDAAIILFRIVQEGLSNIVRHGAARHVRLALGVSPEGLEVMLSDDGCGFDAQQPQRQPGGTFGLMAMRQRVHSLGGTVSIESAAGRGTTVRIQLPAQ